MTIKAWLVGHDFDLQELAELLPTGDTRVIKEGDRYYLTSTEIDNRPHNVPFYEVAPVVLRRVNGLGRTMNPSFRPVRLSNTYDGENGLHHVALAGTAHARDRVAVAVITASGEESPSQSPPPGPKYAAAAATRDDLKEALTVMGQSLPLGWVEMYKVFEIIRDSVKPQTIAGLGWTTDTELSAFTGSANRPDVSGDSARHARMAGGPPRHSMSKEEGRQFISKIVVSWLNHQKP